MSEKIIVNGITFTEEMILNLAQTCKDLENKNEFLKQELISTLGSGLHE